MLSDNVSRNRGQIKTILCRKLLSSLDSKYKTAYIPNPYLRPDELKAVVAEELEVPGAAELPPHKLIPELDNLLNRTDLRQLKQRIMFAEYLKPFDRQTVMSYVNFRLSSASVYLRRRDRRSGSQGCRIPEEATARSGQNRVRERPGFCQRRTGGAAAHGIIPRCQS